MTISKNLSDLTTNVSLVDAKEVMANNSIQLPSGFDKAVINDNNKLYGFVSKNFSMIQPSDIIETFGNEFDKRNIKFDVSGKIDNRGNYQVRYGFDDEKNLTKKVGDLLRNLLGINGGLSGGQSFGLNKMAERLICLNGLTMFTNESEVFAKVRNTKNVHANKLGINFDLLIPIIENWLENNSLYEKQEILIDMELKNDHILPFFYEATKGTKFPESKFQDAFDRMKLEASNIGYTSMNRYLAYNGLNYILEHDSMSLDVIKTSNIDRVISSKTIDLSISQAVKNFNSIVRTENQRIETYKSLNDGKEPRGKRKVLELV
jgi:hypothetical protein